MDEDKTIPYGYCHCGCGERTKLAARTDAGKGWIKGQPLRFVNGHNRRLAPVEYLPEDRGHETPCFIWQRHLDENGYGRASRRTLAHRLYYERARGPVPEGLELDHLCRVPACVNPDHLEPVTHVENIRRGAQTKLTAEQVREIRGIAAAELEARRAQGFKERSVGWWHDVASRYGVAYPTISNIVRGLRWRDV